MAHIMKAKVSDAGKLDTEAFDEKYRAKQDRVDPTRTKDNRLLMVGADGKPHGFYPKKGVLANAVKRATEKHKETAGRKVRSDAVGSVNIVITLPLELRDYSDPKEVYPFFGYVGQFLRDRYGSDFACAAVHMDESTPHMHAYVIPMVNGKLNAKKMFDRAEFNSFHGDLQAFMDARMPGLSILTSTEEERAERRQARRGTEGKKTLAELKADTVRAEREYDDLAVCLTSKKKELDGVTRETDTKKKERDSVSAELNNARSQLARVQHEQEEEEERLDRMRAETERLAEQVNVKRSELNSTKNKLDETEKMLTETEEEYRYVGGLVWQLQKEYEEIAEKIMGGAVAQAIKEWAKERYESLTKKLTPAEEALNALSEAVESHTVNRSAQYDDRTL